MKNFEVIKKENGLFNIIDKQTGEKISDKDYKQVEIKNYGIVATAQLKHITTYDIFNNSGKQICSFSQQNNDIFNQKFDFKFNEKYFEVTNETTILDSKFLPYNTTDYPTETSHFYDYNGNRIASGLFDEKQIIEKSKYLIVCGFSSTDKEQEEPLYAIYDTEAQKTVFNSVGVATIYKSSLDNINKYNTLCFKKLYMESVREIAKNFVNRYFEYNKISNYKDVVLNDIDKAVKTFESNISNYRFAKIDSKLFDKLKDIASPTQKQKELLNIYSKVDLMLKVLDTQEVITKGFIHQIYNEKTDEIILAVNYFDAVANKEIVNKVINSFNPLDSLITTDKIEFNVEKSVKNHEKDSWLIKYNFKNGKFMSNSKCMGKINQLELAVVNAYNSMFNKSVKVLDEEDNNTL